MSAVRGFGIVRANEPHDDVPGLFAELCSRAKKATAGSGGVALRPVIATSYRELVTAIGEGDLALAWLPPFPTMELERKNLGTVLAIPARSGLTTYHTALVVRKGGPKTLEELRGKRAAWVQRDSASGYLVPRMHLAAAGFDVLHFFSRELFVHSHAGVIEAVTSGEADVGAAYCHVDETGTILRGPWTSSDGEPDAPIDVLATYGPIPNDGFVASNELLPVARDALAKWLREPDDRSRELLMRIVGTADLRAPTPEHYEALRRAIAAARARSHEAAMRGDAV